MKTAVLLTISLFLMTSIAMGGPATLSYQGSLVNSGATPVADGTYNMRFTIFDAATGGTQRWQEIKVGVQVTKGLFSTTLGDTTLFGSTLFNTYSNLWLEIAVDLDKSTTYIASETFNPRQKIASAPWAIEADKLQGKQATDFVPASHTSTWGNGSHIPYSGISNANVDSAASIAWYKISKSGALPSDVGAAAASHTSTVGNGSHIPFTGISNANVDLFAAIAWNKISKSGALPSDVGAAAAVHNHNSSYWSLLGNSGTVAGSNFIGTTDNNPFEIRVNNQRALQVAPASNSLDGPNIKGGHALNAMTAGVIGGTIAGGGSGRAFPPNQNISDNYCFIGGGAGNNAGNFNSDITDAQYATVVGGLENLAIYPYSTIGGGRSNQTMGTDATVPGGYQNIATGRCSFAAGYKAQTNDDGSFAWADTSSTDQFIMNGANKFGARASGGFYFYSNSGASVGVRLAPGSGSWDMISDRNAKENFTPVDSKDVLEKVANLPVSTWNYKTENRAIRHMGPMAQDLRKAFGLGDSDKAITTIDADGVALAAIQGLHRLVQEKDGQIAQLKDAVEMQRRQIEEIKKELAKIKSGIK